MHYAVEGLLKFSDIMYRSNASTLAAKAKTFDLNVDPSEITKFEKKTLQLVNQHADGIQNTLADRLTMGITFRRIRLLYETTHHKKLQSRPYLPLPVFNIHALLAAQDTSAESNPSPLKLPSTAEAEAEAEAEATVPATVTDSPTDTSDDRSRDAGLTDSSDEEDDASITSADLDYLCPQPPRLRYGERSCRCTWCPEMLDESDLNTPGWWRFVTPYESECRAANLIRKHVKEDLDIYVCISEHCSNPTVYFKTFSEWHNHMKKAHGSNWAEEVYSIHYYCNMDACGYITFTNRPKFERHMIDQHHHELTDAQMQVKLCLNFSASSRKQNHCPICNRNVLTSRELRPHLLKKPSKGKERKHVPQPQQRIEVEDSEELSSSDSDESTDSCRIDDAEAQHRAKLISVNRQKVARHVGRHLKELAFLSIRGLGHTPRPEEFEPESSVSELSSTESESDTESELGESEKSGADGERQPPEAKEDQTMDDFPETQGSPNDSSNIHLPAIQDLRVDEQSDEDVSENEDESTREQPVTEMFIGQKMWRIRDVPQSWTKRALTDTLRHHPDLQVTNALLEDDNGAFVHTLAGTGQLQHATVRFQRLPEKLATLDISDELTIDIRAGVVSPMHTFTIDQHFDGCTTVFCPSGFSPPISSPSVPRRTLVVAFPDLGNHPFESFMNPQDGHMWLSDSLPLDIPTATVMICSYKSFQRPNSSSVDMFMDMIHIWCDLPADGLDDLIFISHGVGGVFCGALKWLVARSFFRSIRLLGLISFGFPHSDEKDKQLQRSDTASSIQLTVSENFSQILAQMWETVFRKGVSHDLEDKIFCFHQRHVSQTASEVCVR